MIEYKNCYVFGICIAYEQGVGKGREGRCKREDNPYGLDSNEAHGWGYGWDEGNEWRRKKMNNE